MPHMLLINEPVGQRATRSEAEGRATYERMLRWGEDLKERGLLLAAESLASLDTAVRVTVPTGKVRIVDGPFAEAKEMVGGFFMVNVDSRDEAIALAAECPAAEWATVEVRALAPCFMR
ncbi:YciI family protein [Massilia sp. CFBP9026]|uniref:YciI family protein n=1 Tax=Massilia sp. CFBP9026 TaxID=3096536 RepID=UPI002A6A913F|nr:YciI family protein [Massilia sp. CFBP9026]MDY0963625.1 YciI family protein [Massilia sp. CFBP9026]